MPKWFKNFAQHYLNKLSKNCLRVLKFLHFWNFVKSCHTEVKWKMVFFHFPLPPTSCNSFLCENIYRDLLLISELLLGIRMWDTNSAQTLQLFGYHFLCKKCLLFHTKRQAIRAQTIFKNNKNAFEWLQHLSNHYQYLWIWWVVYWV